ncbi:MAG: hypothetical protein IK006_01745 [Bacteroidaceae bacterium]|nr:hypothetical protein [Bacteroidaceae bacterium]
MKKERIYKIDECEPRRPFTVPEGYFENLTQNIMASLPQQESIYATKITVTPWMRIRPYLYAAAAFIGIFFCIKAAVGINSRHNSQETVAEAQETTIYSDEYIDSFLETAMIDDYTLYYTLVDAN